MRPLFISLLVVFIIGCERSSARRPPDSGAPSGVVDSTLPREETLRRFRRGMDSIDQLTGGASSREELVRRFVTALGSRDTVALRNLAMTKREFGWIYYPTTPQGLPPYDLEAGLLWFLIEGRGTQGIQRALRDLGGKNLRYQSHRCDEQPSVEGGNKIWGPCDVTLGIEEATLAPQRLFGLILEREGRFKFVNYANKLE